MRPPGAHHPPQLAHAARQIGDVAHAERRESAVEGARGVGQGLSVGDLGRHPRQQVGRVQLAAPRPQHLAREVGRHHARTRGAPHDLQRAVQGPGPEVEEAGRLACALQQPADGLAPPQDVDPRRHHPVGGVIARRDAVEHLLHRATGGSSRPVCGARSGGRGRGGGRRSAHSPSSFHSPSTRATTSGGIFRTSGHSRVNPSSFHLRVASIPILPPKPMATEA